MYLARVTGRLVASTCYGPGLEGVRFQWIQPLDERGEDMGEQLVAAVALSIGPGDLVHFIDGREAALALPDETFVPIDATITGFIEQAAIGSTCLRQEA